VSGFDSDWLALREPADRAARAETLVETLSSYLDPLSNPRVLDIGCGTGSTWRSLCGLLPKNVCWTLLDSDRLLLDEAKRRIGKDQQALFCEHDLNDIAGLPLDGVAVVSASALFDLCSEAFCASFVKRLVEQRCGLYAALNYDGTMTWTLPHPLDRHVVADFNLHQHADKGFGAALGPDAVACLSQHLSGYEFQFWCVSSPWRIDGKSAALQVAFLNGLRQPLQEIGHLSDVEIEDWLSYRLSVIDKPESLCEVGHTDLLALPV
jgi:SAM-dependent methyltransferase